MNYQRRRESAPVVLACLLGASLLSGCGSSGQISIPSAARSTDFYHGNQPAPDTTYSEPTDPLLPAKQAYLKRQGTKTDHYLELCSDLPEDGADFGAKKEAAQTIDAYIQDLQRRTFFRPDFGFYRMYQAPLDDRDVTIVLKSAMKACGGMADERLKDALRNAIDNGKVGTP